MFVGFREFSGLDLLCTDKRYIFVEPNNTAHFIIILLVKTVVKMLNIYA